MPDKTPPVVTNNEIIAQFIPSTAAELGSPKHVPQAYKELVINVIIIVIVLMLFIIIVF